MAAIELPEFMSAHVIERTYRRAMELQNCAREPFWNGGRRARQLRDIGVRMAIERDPRLLLFLEKSAAWLRTRSEEQLSRMRQLGYSEGYTEYGEAQLFRTAYEKADAPLHDEDALHAIWGWVYAATAEALGH